MHELSPDEAEASPRVQRLRPGGACLPPQNIHLDLRRSVFDSAHVQKMRPLSFPEITSVTSGFRGLADALPQKGSVCRLGSV